VACAAFLLPLSLAAQSTHGRCHLDLSSPEA